MYKKWIEKIADRMVQGNDSSWEMNIEHFDWGPGVGLYGIWCAYEETGRKDYLEALIHWADVHIGEASCKRTINSAAPCLTLWELYKLTGDKAYEQVCLDMAEYLTAYAPLTADGGLEHTVTEDVPGMKEQMWADTLFMACIFLARLGKDTDRPEFWKFAARQLVLHYQFLWDEEKELFFHGWNGLTRSHMSGVRWGRANAWILVSTLEIVKVLTDFEGREQVISLMKRHINSLCRSQRENGLFGTILDDEESYDEVSASAGIACGLKAASREYAGELHVEAAAERVCRGLLGYILEEGSVTGVSTGTPVMPDAQAYKEIDRGVTLYGQALTIMALGEGV